jgi:hypothetical protein
VGAARPARGRARAHLPPGRGLAIRLDPAPAHRGLVGPGPGLGRALRQRRPPAGGVIDERDLWASWTANLTPHPRHLVEAHRQFWRTLYEVPARELGFGRWGVKEVRLGLDEAIYLRFLFPTARFVFLYRNPYAGYRSYRHWMPWYERWPDRPVLGASAYGRMWKRLVSGFVANPAAVDALVLRYEDLARDDAQIQALATHLDLTLSGDAQGVEVRGPRGTPPTADVPQLEVLALRRAVEPLASQLGYSPR